MVHRLTFNQDRGIYGRKDWPAEAPDAENPFAVFKDEKGWTIGHIRTGLSVASLLPRKYPRTRKALLDFIGRLQDGEPCAMRMMHEIDGFPVRKELRWAVPCLVNWVTENVLG